MSIVVDLKDFGVRTPEQVFRIFYKLYDAEKVKNQLWQIFGEWSSARDNQPSTDDRPAAVALLFDQLIALTEALEKLKHRETTANTCVLCGSEQKKIGGEAPITPA